MKLFGNPIQVHPSDTKLNEVLAEFKSGGGYMAVVADTDERGDVDVKGIVTLKDILEKILGDRILDEKHSRRTTMVVGDITTINREGVDKGRLRLWDTTEEDGTLSAHEVKALASFLHDHVPAISQSLVASGQEQYALPILSLIVENSVVLNLKASKEPIYQLGRTSTVGYLFIDRLICYKHAWQLTSTMHRLYARTHTVFFVFFF